MTDREKLIELISEVQYMGGLEEKLADHLLSNGVRLEEKQATSDADKQWIPVTERLPEAYVSVLTLRRRIEDGVCSQRVDNIVPAYNETFAWFDVHSWETKVTHWMPLPAPPKEE